MKSRTLLCWIVFVLTPPAHAQQATSISSLERFIDGVMQRSIVTGETVGATVALVQNGRLAVARGYGLANRADRRPVESRQTQFRIGSISKVFVWISVLQLREAGKLDLDADVNDYLTDFELSSDFTDPITLRHLMTHTPGFEDDFRDLFVQGPRQVGVLAEVLAANMPARVGLPGNMVSYSNYGAALAGLIVANVSGMSFEEYVEQNVFKPLNMATATIRQPVPAEIEATRSSGYTVGDDQIQERGFSYIPLAPAGAGTATALDMARLMAELLNERGTSLLSQESKRLIMNGAYLNHPQLNGMTMGMYEMSKGATRAVGHAGNTLLFDSVMILWPGENMGLFVSSNTLSGKPVAQTLVDTVADYLGFNDADVELVDVDQAAPYLGEYIGARRNHSNFTKLAGLANTAEVTYDRLARELVITDAAGRKRFKQVGEHLFQHINGSLRVAFKVVGPQATEMFFSDRPMVGYTRAAGMLSPSMNQLFLLLWVGLAITVLLVWPASSLTHRDQAQTKGQRLLSVITYLSIALVVAFVAQVGLALPDAYTMMFGGLDAIPPLLWYPVVVAVLVLWLFISLYRVWAEGFWWRSRRLHFTLVVFAQCGLVGWFYYWNLFPAQLLLK